jgi:hypothetical protein
LRPLALGLAAVLLAAACGVSQQAQSPLGGCGDDARFAGAYPELERLLPAALEGRPADKVDSGQSCSAGALSTLSEHGIHELRFAGATWTQGAQDGTVIARFTSVPGEPDLDQTWMQDFYEAGAKSSTKTENITVDYPQLGTGGRYWRLETLNDLSLQTVAVWGGDPATVHVVIVATQVQPGASRDEHNLRVDRAIRAVLDGPAP